MVSHRKRVSSFVSSLVQIRRSLGFQVIRIGAPAPVRTSHFYVQPSILTNPAAALGMTGPYTGFVGSASVSLSLHTKHRRSECILYRAFMEMSSQSTPCLIRSCPSKRHSSSPGSSGLVLSWTTSVPSMMLTLARSTRSYVLILMAMERMSSWLRSWALIPQARGELVFGVTSVSEI